MDGSKFELNLKFNAEVYANSELMAGKCAGNFDNTEKCLARYVVTPILL